jgi:hypothetical protein
MDAPVARKWRPLVSRTLSFSNLEWAFNRHRGKRRAVVRMITKMRIDCDCISQLATRRCTVLEIPVGADMGSILAALAKDGRVLAAQLLQTLSTRSADFGDRKMRSFKKIQARPRNKQGS